MFDEFRARFDEGELATVALGFAASFAIHIGLLGLGVALGTHLGLYELQASCVAAGGLPPDGALLPPDMTAEQFGQTFPCWDGAKLLQQISNWSGRAGAVLLLAGGVVDSFDEEIVERWNA